jgi:NAD(P)-dependent dehydrogenase (short-subunit alcohol dehydrogenase family)
MASFDLSTKTVIVTGASRGIGAAIATTCAEHGARVVLAARKLEPLEALAQELRGRGHQALAVACHTGKPEDVRGLVARAVEHFGAVDALVNNAATNPYFGPLLDTEDGAWDKTFEVNLKGYFVASREVARHLIARGAPGSIVNIASIMAMVGAPMQGVYGMTKAAIVSMTKTMAVELGHQHIRVNAVSPGLVETKFASALLASDMISKPVIERTPLGRVGQPDDIAGAVAYLVGDASRFVTGQNFVLDGGYTAT